jgi:hypothetical protein
MGRSHERQAAATAQKANESEQALTPDTDKFLSELNKKDDLGPKQFRQLQEWIEGQVAHYNNNRGNPELKVSVLQGRDWSSSRPTQEIVVKRTDNSRSPLTINYSPSAHTIRYQSVRGSGEFVLTIDDDSKAYFETPYHVRKTIEEMGQEMLESFAASPF